MSFSDVIKSTRGRKMNKDDSEREDELIFVIEQPLGWKSKRRKLVVPFLPDEVQ